MQEERKSKASNKGPKFNYLQDEQIEEVKQKLKERNDYITKKKNENHRRSMFFILLSAAGAFFSFMYLRS